MFEETLDALRQLLWPSRCASCDLLLDSPTAKLCSECLDAVRFAGTRKSPESIDCAFSFFYYEGAIQSLISRWKYHEDYAARQALLACLTNKVDQLVPTLNAPLDVIPVPPHPRRLRERGFDPVWTIASKLTSLLQTSLGQAIRLDDETLVRSRHTVHQAGLDADERAKNLVDAFGLTREAPKRVLLIDDVMTTGATLTACAKALRQAGTTYVYSVTLACTDKA